MGMTKRTMIVIDVVEVNWKPVDRFCNAGIPGGVVNGTVKVVHAGWIWLGFCLLPEYWGVKKNICDISKLVILNGNFVFGAHGCDFHRFSHLIRWIVNSATAWNHPDQVLMTKIFA